MEKGTQKVAATQGVAAPTKKIKTSNIKVADLDKKNTETVKEQIKEKKEDMYKYEPSDMAAADKKKFRATARRTRDSFFAKIAKAEGEEALKLQAEANAWAKVIYNKHARPVF